MGINSHYLQKRYFFPLICNEECIFHFTNNALTSKINSANQLNSIGSSKGIYDYSYGSSFEPLITKIENEFLSPTIDIMNKFARQFMPPANFERLIDDMDILSYEDCCKIAGFIFIQIIRNPNQKIYWVEKFKKECPEWYELNKQIIEDGSFYPNMLLKIFGCNSQSNKINLMAYVLISMNIKIHLIQDNSFCYGSQPIVICKNDDFNNINIKNIDKININNIKNCHSLISTDNRIIIPISKNIIIEFVNDGDSKLTISVENKISEWFLKYSIFQIGNAEDFLVTSNNLIGLNNLIHKKFK